MATSWMVKKPFVDVEEGGKLLKVLGVNIIVHPMRQYKGREFCVVDLKAELDDATTDSRMMTFMIEGDEIDIINPDGYRFQFMQYAKEIIKEQLEDIKKAADLTDVFG